MCSSDLPRSIFSEAVFWLEHPLYRLASLAAAGLIAVMLTSVAARSWVRAQLVSANTLTNAATRPVRITPIPVHSALDFTLDVAKTESESSPRVADRLPPWFGYDLDRGTPMNNPDTGQIKASY